jgi:hypothetical protein
MPALLIRNLDRRRFEDVSMEVGPADVPGPGLGILTGDSTPTAGSISPSRTLAEFT